MPQNPSADNRPQEKLDDDKRRSHRLTLRVAVVVIGTDAHGNPFGELTHTIVVNAHGGLVELKAELNDGQRVLLRNKQSGERQSCHVVWFRKAEQGVHHAGLEFDTAAPKFWQVDFLPGDWDLPVMRASVLKEFGQPFATGEMPRPAPLVDTPVRLSATLQAQEG